MVAARLMVGHITATVPACRISWQKAGESRRASHQRAPMATPSRLPHKLENRTTKRPMYHASSRAPRKTLLVILLRPPGVSCTPSRMATL